MRAVLCIGEALPRDVVTSFARLSDAPVVNLYGPTEAAVDSTFYVVDREFSDSESLPIGRACSCG